MEYHEHITRESIKALTQLVEEYDLDPRTLSYILVFIGERIAKSITPATLEEVVAGVVADAIDNAQRILANNKFISAKRWG